MPKNTKINIHKQRLKAIRPYVNFDFDLRKDLTKAQQRKIKKYYDEFDALTARPYQVVKNKDTKKLKAAMEYSGQNSRLKGFKAAFVPTPGDEKVKVKFDKNGSVKVESNFVVSSIVKLDPKKLAANTEQYVNSQVAPVNAQAFTIIAGKYEIPSPVSKSRVGAEISKLTAKYSNQSENNYFGNWLHGVRAHNFKNQATVADYINAKQAAKSKNKARRKSTKRKAKRK